MDLRSKEIQQFSSLEFLAKQVVEGFITGLHKSPFHGFSVEFAEHRLYNSGESTKHIDWKLFARSEKLFIKRYEEETNLRCQIIIDNSGSMHYPEAKDKWKENNKISFAIKSAAALIELLKRQRDAYGLSVFTKTLDFHINAKASKLQYDLIHKELNGLLDSYNLESKKGTDVIHNLHQLAEVIHRRSLIIIFSDMQNNVADNEKLFQALQHFKHNKHEVILFHVVDPKTELDFEFDNKPYLFVDLESNTEIKLNPNDVKELYLKKAKEQQAALKDKCGQFKIDFVEADINQGFDQILLSYLIKRNKIK